MKVLLVEDSPRLQRSITAGLQGLGYVVDQAQDGELAQQFIDSYSYDAVILDLMLPKRSGLEVLKRARASGVVTPILILSAKDQTADRVLGLNLGADDYLVKPFEFDELVARIESLTRRAARQASSTIEVNGLTIDALNRQIFVGGKPLDVTPLEYRLISTLCAARGRAYAADELIDRLYDAQADVSRNAVEVLVSGVRKKLKQAGLGEFITTRRGFGYVVS